MSIDFNAELASAKTLKPATIGERLGGVIVAADKRQVTDYATGDPLYWQDGKPKEQFIITVKDTNNEEQACYIKNWGAQRHALIEAIKATGVDANTALAPGNTFHVTFIGEEPNEKNPRFNATKLYKYEFGIRANVGDSLNDATPNPVHTTASASASTSVPNPAETARQLINAGLDDTTIATTTGLAPDVIAALRATPTN